jgi:hypothetical protein
MKGIKWPRMSLEIWKNSLELVICGSHSTECRLHELIHNRRRRQGRVFRTRPTVPYHVARSRALSRRYTDSDNNKTSNCQQTTLNWDTCITWIYRHLKFPYGFQNIRRFENSTWHRPTCMKSFAITLKGFSWCFLCSGIGLNSRQTNLRQDSFSMSPKILKIGPTHQHLRNQFKKHLAKTKTSCQENFFMPRHNILPRRTKLGQTRKYCQDSRDHVKWWRQGNGTSLVFRDGWKWRKEMICRNYFDIMKCKYTMRNLRHSTACAPDCVRNIVSQLISHPYVNRMKRQVRIYCRRRPGHADCCQSVRAHHGHACMHLYVL